MADQTAKNINADNKPFSKCAFGNERLQLARLFTHYFDRTNSDSGYVANLNGEWGTGKTFFVTEWSKLLIEDKYGVVFIDAWESDYLDDPLAIIVAEMLEQLTKQLTDTFGFDDIEKIKTGVFKAASGLTKAFLPAVMVALGKKYFGEEFIEACQQFVSDTKELSNTQNAGSISDRLGDFGEFVFSSHQQHLAFSDKFKTELSKIIDEIVKRSNKRKVYVFIDELDRCRPTYAIEMLETIKHLFDIKNLVFIISTDTAQLEHSIKAVYGNDFGSFEYLHRFFKQRITLPKPDYYKFLCMTKAFEGIDFKAHHYYPKIDSADKLRALVALQAETNDIELRKLEHIYSQIDIFLTNMENKKKKAVDLICLVATIFTINLSASPIINFISSLRQASGGAGLTVNKIRINPPLNGARDYYYNEVACSLVSNFDNLQNYQLNTHRPDDIGFNHPFESMAQILFEDIAGHHYLSCINDLINCMNQQELTLLTNKDLFKAIQQLGIHDLLNE